MTQKALAEMLGIPLVDIILIERGLRDPPYALVVGIARALGVTVEHLCSPPKDESPD